MKFKNLIKKSVSAVLLGATLLSLPTIRVNALTQDQEHGLINKYLAIIEENNTSIMNDLMHQIQAATTNEDIFDVEDHLDVVDYDHLFEVVNGSSINNLDAVHISWPPLAVIEAAIEGFPQILRSAIIRDYHDISNSAPASKETEILISFLRISDSIRTKLIQRYTVDEQYMSELNLI